MLSATAINTRQQTLWLLTAVYFNIAMVSSVTFNDISNIITLSQHHWIQTNHAKLKWLSNNLMFGFYLTFISLFILAWLKKHHRLKLICQAYFLTQLIGSVLVVGALKRLFGHARPSQFIHHGITSQDAWIGPTTNVYYFGFPSGHTCDYLISCLFLALLLPKRWMQALAIILAMLEGFFRLALAKHFPIDVLGAVLVAGLCSYGVIRYWLIPRLEKVNMA